MAATSQAPKHFASGRARRARAHEDEQGLRILLMLLTTKAVWQWFVASWTRCRALKHCNTPSVSKRRQRNGDAGHHCGLATTCLYDGKENKRGRDRRTKCCAPMLVLKTCRTASKSLSGQCQSWLAPKSDYHHFSHNTLEASNPSRLFRKRTNSSVIEGGPQT